MAVSAIERQRLQRAVDTRHGAYQLGDSLYIWHPRVLVRNAAGITPQGRVYQELLAARGGDPGRAEHLNWFHHDAEIHRQGNFEWTRDRRGTYHRTRSWDPAEDRWNFTAAGRRLYEHEHSRFIVEIPAYAHFLRPARAGRPEREDAYRVLNGQPVTVPLDLEDTALPAGLDWVRNTGNLQRMKEFLREAITRYIDRLRANPDNIDASGRVILREFNQSDVKYTFDPHRLGDFNGFTFSAEGVETRQDHRRPFVETILNRPLQGVLDMPPEMWNAVQLLPEATVDFHGDCVRQQLHVCVRMRDRRDGRDVHNGRPAVELGDLELLFDTAEQHCYPGLRQGEAYSAPTVLSPTARAALEKFIDAWRRMFAAGATRKLADLIVDGRKHLTRGQFAHLGSFADALRGAIPGPHRPVEPRYLAFFKGFPEVFRVYERTGAGIDLDDPKIAVWRHYAAIDEALLRGPKPEPYDAATWRTVGVTPHMVLFAADELDRSVYVFHNDAKIFEAKPPSGNTENAIVLNVWGKHAFFYKPGRASHDAHETNVRARSAVEPLKLQGCGERKKVPFDDLHCWGLDRLLCYLTWLRGGRPEQESAFREILESDGLDPSEAGFVLARCATHPERWRDYDLAPILEELRARKVPVFPSYSSPSHLQSLTMRLHGVKIHIKCVPENALQLNEFSERFRLGDGTSLDLPYHGEGQGTVAMKALQAAMANRRIRPVLLGRERILEEQDYCCDRCGERSEHLDIHHIKPIKAGGSHERENLVALCRSCHEDETIQLRESGVPTFHGFESDLSPRMLEIFLLRSPKPRQLHWGAVPPKRDRKRLMLLDVNGCRRNAILNAPSIPQFGPADEFVPFAAPPATNVREYLRRFHYFWIRRESSEPLTEDELDLYDGEHSYSLLITEQMLDAGIVTLADIRFSARASREVDRELLQDAWTSMADLCDDQFSPIPGLSGKAMVLSSIGVMNRTVNLQWQLTESSLPEDAPRVDRITCGLDDLAKPRFWSTTRVISCRTAYPIGLMALQTEQVSVFSGLQFLREAGATIHGVLTDGIFYTGVEVDATARYPHTGGLVYKVEKADPDKCPDNARVHEDRSQCFPPLEPWRAIEETDSFLVDGEARRTRPLNRLLPWAPPQVVSRIAEFVGDDTPGYGPTDVSRERFDQLADIVIHNGGGLVLGPAGTGKTTFVSGLKADGRRIGGLMSRWRRREPDVRFLCTAVTHKASRLLPRGRTLAHLLQRHQYGGSKLRNVVFIIDEVSQIPLSTWARIAQWKAFGARFVLLGDFHQFQPIRDAWCDSAISVQNADILRQLARSLRVEFRVNRRSALDPHLFANYTALYPIVDEPNALLACREQMRARYPWRGESPGLVLVISHHRRMRLNAHYNRLRDHTPDAVLVPCVGSTARAAMQPQTMWVRPGQRLIGCSSYGARIVHSAMYIVAAVGVDFVEVNMAPECRAERLTPEGEPLPVRELQALDRQEVDIRLTHAEASQYLRLAHALCYASVQGSTIADHLLMLDLGHRYFTMRSLIVGMSRATHGAFVHMATAEQQRELLDFALPLERFPEARLLEYEPVYSSSDEE